MSESAALWALFTSSFLAATLLPGGSEVTLFAFLKMHPGPEWLAIGVATLGNTLGGLSSYFIGRLIPQTKPLRGLPALEKYGSPLLLLSWVPVIGDPLCVAAGWLRLNVIPTACFIAIGKLLRYCFVAAVAL